LLRAIAFDSRWARSAALSLGLVLFFLSFPLFSQQSDQTKKANEKSTQVKKQEPSRPSSTATNGDSRQTPRFPLTGYRIGPDDELGIAVWHEPELSQGVVVRPDGMITLPLLNDVHVAGLTTDELQALLTEKLKSVVNDPQVTVTVKAVKSQKVFMVGAVAKQGAYPLNGSLTVLQLIAEAGGLGPFAKSKGIYILRNENGKQVRIPFNYKKALSGQGNDPILQPGDMVVVP
jgi:polysaccharide biosynthesis/export protein